MPAKTRRSSVWMRFLQGKTHRLLKQTGSTLQQAPLEIQARAASLQTEIETWGAYDVDILNTAIALIVSKPFELLFEKAFLAYMSRSTRGRQPDPLENSISPDLDPTIPSEQA